MSVEPFNRLVKLTARAFYDDVTTKGDSHIKSGRSDNRGIAVIVLDALTRRQWVREEDLAKDLKLHGKQLRRTLRFFEEEKLVTRDHRRETAKGAKVFTAAMAAVSDNQRTKDGEEKIKMHTHSYCCLDYAQIFDVVRYRLHRMKKKLKDELEDKNTIQEYVCTKCPKRYNALDALRLVSMEDEYFHCENCNAELVAQSAKSATQEGGDGDDNARRRRTEKLKDMLQNMDGQLKPLMEQLNRLKDLSPPEYGTLQSWEARVHAAGRPNPDAANDQSRSQAFGLSGTPMPFLGETKVEVAFSGADVKGEDTNSGSGSAPLKVLPPWMIKKGMKLTEEQRGEVKHEVKMEGSSADVKEDKKAIVGESNEEDVKGEYLKAYYAAMSKREEETTEAQKRQEELLNTQRPTSLAGTSSDRQVGMKFKREEDGDDDDGWEEDTPAVTVNANKSFKVDLNVEAGASEEDDGDGSDWEDGE